MVESPPPFFFTFRDAVVPRETQCFKTGTERHREKVSPLPVAQNGEGKEGRKKHYIDLLAADLWLHPNMHATAPQEMSTYSLEVMTFPIHIMSNR